VDIGQSAFEKITRWLFFKQYSREPYIVVLKAMKKYPERSHQWPRARRAVAERWAPRARGEGDGTIQDAFRRGRSLYHRRYRALRRYARRRLADYDIERFPHISAWLERVATDDFHVLMEWFS
jgi:glutathione S-transferase